MGRRQCAQFLEPYEDGEMKKLEVPRAWQREIRARES